MILKKLTLKNYRRFKELNIDFEENINVFIGKNGSGKTTIFEAILYALFGTQMVRTAKEDIKADFADQDHKCKVCLTFELEDEQYKIERIIKGKNSITSAYIYSSKRGDNPVAERESGVNEFVQKLLSMDSTTFKISVFSAQKELDKFSSLQPEKRKEEIRRLLNIDIIKNAIKILRSDIKENKTRIEILKSQQVDTKEIKNNIKQIEDNLDKQKLALKRLIKLSKKLTKKLEKQTIKVKNLEELSRRAVKLDNSINVLKSQLDGLKDDIKQQTKTISDLKVMQSNLIKVLPIKKDFQKAKEKKKLFDLEKEKYLKLKSFQKQFKDENSDKDQQNKTLELLKIKIKKLLPNLEKEKNIKKEIEDVSKKIEIKNNNLIKVEQKIEALGAKFKEVDSNLRKIKKLGKESACPTCTRVLNEQYDYLVKKFTQEGKKLKKNIKDKQNKAQKIELKLQALNKQKDSFTDDLEIIQENIGLLKEKKTKEEGVVEQITKSKKKIEDLVSQIKRLGKIDFHPDKYKLFIEKFDLLEKKYESIIKLETEVKQLPKAEEKKQQHLEKQKILTKKHIEKITKRNLLNFNEQEFIDVKEKKDELEKKDKSLIKEMAETKGIIQTTITERKSEQEKLTGQKKLISEIKKVSKRNRILESLEPLFQEFETDLLARIRPILEKETSNLLQIISQGKYSDVELDSSYEAKIDDKGERYKIKRFSGGEEDLINLCLRLAISRVISEKSGGRKINFLILDEIFASQDEERQKNILQALQGLSTQFRQLFLITHVANIKDNMPIVYHVDEVNRNESRVRLLK